MKSFKLLALAATFGLGSVTAAHAAVVNNSFVLQNALAGVQGEYNSQFDISDVGNDAFTETPVTHVANDTFIDDYYFNLPESSGIDFDVAAAFSPTAEVSFSSAILYTATGDFQYSFGTMSFSPTAISASDLSLTSGEYALEIIGTTLVDGGSYSGLLNGIPGDFVPPTSAVPEPVDAALMLAGLGILAGVVRRRARVG